MIFNRLSRLLVAYLLLAAWHVQATTSAPVAQSTTEQPVAVDITININKLYGVNSIDETYQLDGYLVVNWTDQTMKGVHNREVIFENSAAQRIQEEGLWVPALEFINVIGGRNVSNRRIVITPSGKVTYNERFYATFATAMDFRLFPFDQQRFTMTMEPFSYDNKTLKFNHAEVTPVKLEQELLGEWRMTGKPQVHISSQSYGHLSEADESQVAFSRLSVDISVERKSAFYIWQFIVPLTLIIISSWSVFWIVGYAERLAVSFTLMLTVVAYNFYTSNLLPRLPYTTFIEQMVIFGYISIFASIVVVVINEKRVADSVANEHLMNSSRLIFPISFVVGMSWLVGGAWL